MSGEDFLSAALEQYPFYLWFFWRYVFKADLFADRRFLFSDHRSREDVALCYRVILNAGEVLIIKDSLYAYRQNRQESVTQTVTYDTVHAMLSVAAQEISRVRDMNGIPENVRKLLCSNLSKEYFDALTLSSRLSEPERSRILCELEQCKWVAKYRARKDRIKAALIHFFGVSMLSGLMGFKWKLQRSKKRI
jgi:RNase P subunit RPR2